MPTYVRLTGWDSSSACEADPCADSIDRDDDPQDQGMGKRLLVALLLFLGLGAVGLVLALAFEIVVPPIMWLACVGFLVFGVVAAGSSEDRQPRRARLGDEDGALPIGCCPGPRPLALDRREP